MTIGAQAELFALEYLRHRGMILIKQNYHSRFGEIDLIMRDKGILVFIEVRLRNSNVFGGAAASIDARKQRKLVCTAQHYLSKLVHIPPCRFDALLLMSSTIASKLGSKGTQISFIDTDVEWIKNAFSA